MRKIPQDKIFKVTQCRICGGSVFKKWLDLGYQPLANALIDRPDSAEGYFPLRVMYCKKCTLVQLSHVVSPAHLFDDYPYYSSTSSVFVSHFEHLVEKEMNMDRVKKNQLVVDIGSNDGILLAPFKARGVRVLGVEPSRDIASYATQNGIKTISEFFTQDLARTIEKEHGKASLVTMTNVFAHIDDIQEILRGVIILIGHSGRLMIEVPYLPYMINQGTFDLIYHEHLSYFTLATLYQVLIRAGLVILEVDSVPVHGGSLRVYAGSINHELTTDQSTFKAFINYEKHILETKKFYTFADTIESRRKALLSRLNQIKKKGKSIVGYGAPAKLSTMTNYFDIGPETIDYVIDDAPAKQGKYTPGKHIKIVAGPKDMKGIADYIFIFAWNFAESIMMKCKTLNYTGKFIIPFPKLKVL